MGESACWLHLTCRSCGTVSDHLDVDEAFVLVNDHDPKPLYHQSTAEDSDQFSWEYLQTGPEVWSVHISRRAPA